MGEYSPALPQLGGGLYLTDGGLETTLDESDELDDGNPEELGEQYRTLRERMPQINVLGGCCGTDHRHVASIAAACTR